MAFSSITITFTTQALDAGPYTRGAVTMRFNDGDQVLDLFENLTQSVPTTYQFKEQAWIDGFSGEDNQQAINFATAFNRDYKNVGSHLLAQPSQANLSASVVGNVVTINARKGTWENDSSYSGNVLLVVIGAPNNQAQPTTPTLSATATGTGSCTVIEYNTIAIDGTGPYSLTRNGVVIQTGWDGSSQNVAMPRGQVHKLFVTDSLGAVSASKTINVPRKLYPADFDLDIEANVGSSDLTVVDTNPVAGVSPLNYAIVDTGEPSAGYQSSNIFPGILDGTYDLYIKDKFGCEVFRTIVIDNLESPLEDPELRTFIISDFNTLSFSKQDENRKGYLNTLSWQENVAVRKQGLFRFPSTEQIQTQFKSSYPYHKVTLFKCDGSKETLSFIEIQQNIGVAEKVDCKLFPLDDGIGVYFDGGNSYSPGTTTVSGPSPYTDLPVWAETGKVVTIDSLGGKTIQGTGYDSDLGKMYFWVSGTIGAPADDKVQVTFNRHPYNVFRCDFPMTKVSNLAFVRIEAGWDDSGTITVDQTWQSETIKLLSQSEIDSGQYIKTVWSGFKTLENFIFDSSFTGVMWIKGRIRPFSVSEAKTYEGANETYSLEQIARMGQRVTIPVMTPKQWNKFNLVSGITQGGTLLIEDMELVRVSSLEAEEVGDTNFSNVSCDFFFQGSELTPGPEEELLNVDTGQVQQPGLAGKAPVLNWSGFVRLALADGTLIRLESGSFIALD